MQGRARVAERRRHASRTDATHSPVLDGPARLARGWPGAHGQAPACSVPRRAQGAGMRIWPRPDARSSSVPATRARRRARRGRAAHGAAAQPQGGAAPASPPCGESGGSQAARAAWHAVRLGALRAPGLEEAQARPVLRTRTPRSPRRAQRSADTWAQGARAQRAGRVGAGQARKFIELGRPGRQARRAAQASRPTGMLPDVRAQCSASGARPACAACCAEFLLPPCRGGVAPRWCFAPSWCQFAD